VCRHVRVDFREGRFVCKFDDEHGTCELRIKRVGGKGAVAKRRLRRLSIFTAAWTRRAGD
jgi:hypothetical protein